ncbi:Polyphosphate kinase [uncultured Roseburia sp.]|uniref:Polyphosphate kinase n=1 Tax=Brotonthovivens ammoniilytica TaxID=2981725 RepID=A0ABT2THM3_9FIRM|nr:RNA degradosome polyphosphate kinase [Brotonthovivens ammoniilytica]MCU6761366.1 RNA degradosome polyphosphate kinase [Brotonthovivens ammoniilytica]SCI26411.1 Polyphosphate kinase [uncultured Roseburia sp.]
METTSIFDRPEYFENRELSWLKFNARVLNEARDKSIPLLERLKFLSITSSNLDEFFMVRVASLKDMVHAKYKKKDIAGMTAKEQLEAINADTRKLVELQYSTYNRSLIPALRTQGIVILDSCEELTKEQSEYVDQYFMENVYPVLTPMAVDASRPFPLIRNKTLNIAALLSDRKETEGGKIKPEFATVQVPSVLPRFIPIPPGNEQEPKTFLLLEQVIAKNLHHLFLDKDILCAYPYRVMRNADFNIDEDEAEDLLKEIESKLKQRQWGEVIRLEVDEKVEKKLLKILKESFQIAQEDIYKIPGPIDLTFLMKLYGLEGYEHLRNVPYKPQPVPEIPKHSDIFEQIKKGDILLHHPYQTFEPVVDFIRQASVDPDVLAIKQTLYRVSGNSPIIASLAQAAENGKQVTVLVELKARFDEEHNIVWAKKLEKAGCHVIYGLVGLKTHSKIALVVRKEEDGIRRYVHLGTGNYNDSTAKLYTDTGMFTCAESYGEDATAVFNMLSGYSEPKHWNRLVVAPIWLRKKFLYLIKRETEHAKAGKEAHIIAKMNSLCDKEIIEALYEASAAGVRVELIIRGICCLKTGILGVSEHICVHSIVGNFLEHSRIFYFQNDGFEEYYMGSADWMPRNLDRRVEIMFPVEDETLKEKVRHILDVQLADNVKAHILQPDGTYEKIDKRGKILVGSQMQFCEEAKCIVNKKTTAQQERVFIPAEPVQG